MRPAMRAVFGLRRPIVSLHAQVFQAGRLAPRLVVSRRQLWITRASLEQCAPLGGKCLNSLSEPLTAALESQSVEELTEIQRTAIPQLLHCRDTDFLLASHTGSGKTLAYLLPLVQILKETEESGTVTMPKRPRAIVLAPTRELAEQISGVAKHLSHFAKYRASCLTGGRDFKQQRNRLREPVDLVIGTPQRVMQHAGESNLFLGDVETLVLDEADTMLDRGFGPEVERVLRAVRAKARPARCVLVSASLTRAVRRLLSERFPNAQPIETSTLHRGVQGAAHLFVDVAPSRNKLDELLDVIRPRKDQRTMIFTNTVPSCRAVEHHLAATGLLRTLCYHGDMPVQERKAALAEFSNNDNNGWEEDTSVALVCTDLAARGLDIPGRVDHVINFDFPLNPIDYLHRTGRTARAGAKGRITSLITKRDKVLAERIRESLERGLPLDTLSADKRRKPTYQQEEAPKQSTSIKRQGTTSRSGFKQSGVGPSRLRASPKSSLDRFDTHRGTRGSARFPEADRDDKQRKKKAWSSFSKGQRPTAGRDAARFPEADRDDKQRKKKAWPSSPKGQHSASGRDAARFLEADRDDKQRKKKAWPSSLKSQRPRRDHTPVSRWPKTK